MNLHNKVNFMDADNLCLNETLEMAEATDMEELTRLLGFIGEQN